MKRKSENELDLMGLITRIRQYLEVRQKAQEVCPCCGKRSRRAFFVALLGLQMVCTNPRCKQRFTVIHQDGEVKINPDPGQRQKKKLMAQYKSERFLNPLWRPGSKVKKYGSRLVPRLVKGGK